MDKKNISAVASTDTNRLGRVGVLIGALGDATPLPMNALMTP